MLYAEDTMESIAGVAPALRELQSGELRQPHID